MTKQEVYKRITKELYAHFEIRQQLSPQMKFVDLDVDSLDLLMFISEKEKQWKFQIRDDKLIKIITIADLVEIIYKLVNRPPNERNNNN